ncbi:MAG: hypothetical protein IH613_15945 [Desulfuromonadales bacterium]|nr:hypothetical protein [Desulfuromonadales bacterium]
MKKLLALLFMVGLYVALVVPLGDHLRERPLNVKLGYTPDARLLKLVAGGQQTILAESMTLKVIFYFGTVIEHWIQQEFVQPEYFNMFKTIEAAAILDPYNMDTYYFAQAAFTWELGRAKDVNRLLEHGMKYRDWDESLPFYAGFNSAYFLQDYDSAAKYMQKAAEVSGNSMYTNLAARFFYEAGDSRMGVAFLETMIRQAKNPQVKRLYEMRRDVLLAVQTLETGVADFAERFGKQPTELEQLVVRGLIAELPLDPYGGQFFLDDKGRVRTTSKFTEKLAVEPDKGE